VRRPRRLGALALLPLALGCRGPGAEPAAAPDGAGGPAAPAAGRFLVASRQVLGPVFAESVVLLVEQSEGGALGLIVNRPTPIPVGELLPGHGAPAHEGGTAYLGGPVAIDTLRALLRGEAEPEASQRVLEGVYVTSSEATLLHALAAPGAAARVRVYLGYAGWAPGQLEGDDWYVGDADPDAVFSEHPAALWPALIRRHEALRATLPHPGDVHQGDGSPRGRSSSFRSS
jgi:putative transcriptional regulator